MSELDEQLREVDRLCGRREWDQLFALRDRCRAAATQTGRQLWPAANHAEYRLALEGDDAAAARAVTEGSGRFALGPLAEVAASAHQWAALAPHFEPGITRSAVAAECVVRGQDVDDADVDLPTRLQPWEPTYAVAQYEAHKATFPRPDLPARRLVELPTAPAHLDRDDTAVEAGEALLALVTAWVRDSEGRAEVAVVDGSALDAIAALGPRSARVAEVDPAVALAHMAWAGASGGAHGPRPGAATGRFGAWWAAAALTGLDDGWPVPPDELGTAAAELGWRLWDAGEPDTGWSLRLAVEDPLDGLAWAISATDAD